MLMLCPVSERVRTKSVLHFRNVVGVSGCCACAAGRWAGLALGTCGDLLTAPSATTYPTKGSGHWAFKEAEVQFWILEIKDLLDVAYISLRKPHG